MSSFQPRGVSLRLWEPADAGPLAREIQDREIVRWLDIQLPYTVDDAAAFIETTQERWERGEGAHFVIADPVDDRLLGYLGVLAIEEGMTAVEVVYWVAAAERGRGVATEAVSLALQWIDETVQPKRVELGMTAGNEASRRVAEANGFRMREVMGNATRLDGAPADEWIFERTR